MHAFSRPAALPALLAGVAILLGQPLAATAADTTPARQLERFATQAGRPGEAASGEAFFTARHGGEWSCSTCHRAPPSTPGRHASTGKAIDPIAPSANPAALTDTARVDKWFRRNCRDVLSRECTPAEKADVVAYLMAAGR